MQTNRLLFLELNEINFESVRKYVALGHLPELGRLLETHGLTETTSESVYENIEPWIQWVTAHSGKDFAEHKIFRLGDIVNSELPQVWEALEEKGVPVGAISPMNATNRSKAAEFFVPDPWTNAEVTGSFLLKKMYGAIAEAVNENSNSTFSVRSLFWLLAGALAYARPANYLNYLQLAAKSGSKNWNKALFLDLLLSDVFGKLVQRTEKGFFSLFLNAGAHIQHHYMFSSKVYDGEQKNPDWYIEPGFDPVLDVYALYDQIVARIRNTFPDARLMIATGLHQDPHPSLTFYWRLRDHQRFLESIDVEFQRVLPRMSRDFLIECGSEESAVLAQQKLSAIVADDGLEMFDVDNRGTDLFVMLVYPDDIGESFQYLVEGQARSGFREEVAFVAIKNGQHNGTGYFIDTENSANSPQPQFPLREVYSKILMAMAPS